MSIKRTIGFAATEVGRCRDTLRLWEEQGLIRPERASNGIRIYSDGDIQKLKAIAKDKASVRHCIGKKDVTCVTKPK